MSSTFSPRKKLNEVAYDAVEIPGTGFVVVGSSYQAVPNASSQLRLIGTNTSLDDIWSKEYYDQDTPLEQAIRSVDRLPNGNLIITGSKVSGNQQDLLIARVNALNGVIQDEATFGGTGGDSGRDIVALDADNILVAGLRVDAGVSEGPWGLVVDGNLNLTDEYTPSTQGLFNGGIPFSENGEEHFCICGNAIELCL